MTPRILQAQASVSTAREALIDTARELQQRLQPKTLVREAWESAKMRGADIAEDAVDAVKRRPVATGGIIAAIAMFLAREPIKDGVRSVVDAMTSDPKPAPPRPKASKTATKRPAKPPTRRAPRPKRKTETK